MRPEDTDPQGRPKIAAHETAMFELWFAGQLVATERGYGVDHDGDALIVRPIEPAVRS